MTCGNANPSRSSRTTAETTSQTIKKVHYTIQRNRKRSIQKNGEQLGIRRESVRIIVNWDFAATKSLTFSSEMKLWTRSDSKVLAGVRLSFLMTKSLAAAQKRLAKDRRNKNLRPILLSTSVMVPVGICATGYQNQRCQQILRDVLDQWTTEHFGPARFTFS